MLLRSKVLNFRKANGIIFLLLFCVFHLSFCSDRDINKETEEFLADEDSGRPGSRNRLDNLLVQHGDRLLPYLMKMLNDGEERHRSLALYGLSVIGGPIARNVLQKEYSQISDIEERAGVKASLCIALGSTKTEKDIQFLIESLKGPGLTEKGETIWQPKETAALTLGILRAKNAITGLKNCSEYDESGIDTHACRTALLWITSKQIQTPQDVSADETDRLIMKIFQIGIPTTEASNSFYETAHHRRWIRSLNFWRFEPVVSEAAAKDSPSIDFETTISDRKERAVVRVGIRFGPLSGSGYTYFLKKKDQDWEITALVPTWIS